MLAGLGAQVLSLAAFISLCVLFAIRARRASLVVRKVRTSIRMGPWLMQRPRTGDTQESREFRQDPGVNSDALKRKPVFKTFVVCIAIATPLIFIRSIYRVVELSEGFESKLANDETLFFVSQCPASSRVPRLIDI